MNIVTGYKAMAQDIDLAWVKQGAGTGDQITHSLVTDAAGNIYVCGPFSGTGDFDPGPAVFNLTSAGNFDVFVAKYDSNGNFIWAKNMGGPDYDQAVCLALDGSGNVYVTGFFSTTGDFDPGPGVFNLVSTGQWDVFVAKLDAAGNFLWAKRMGGADYEQAYSIAVDAAGNVYSTGEFVSTVADFDPGPGVFNLTSFGSVDVYISKLDAAGNFVWAKQVGGNSIDRVGFITLDAAGNIFLTGHFYSSNADFDPGAGVFNLSSFGSADIFVLKLDAAGNFAWAKQMGGSGDDHGNAVAVDNAGNVYTTGWYLAAGDYDPGPGVYTLPLSASSGVFVSKLDGAGNFVWARQFSGTATNNRVTSGQSIAVDANQNVYTAGGFVDGVDFDPGSGTYNLTSLGEWDIFISVLNSAGNFVTAKQMGGPGIDNALEVTVASGGAIYVTGPFTSSADFDPCPGNYTLVSGGGYDFFIAKFASPVVTISASTTSICSGNPVTFTAVVTNQGLSPVLQWKVNGVNAGTGSTFTTTSLNNNDQVTCVLITNPSCTPPVTDTSNAITITVEPSGSPSVTISTATTTVCTGMPVTFNAAPVNPGNTPVYQWQVNGINAGTNAPSFTTSTLANNDVVRVLLTNSSACASPNTATSNSITMQVGSGAIPSIRLSVSANSVCPGVPVTFTANPINAGPSVSYQWKLNGANAGTNNPVFTLNNAGNSDQVYCIMNTTTSCSANSTFNSDTILVQVKPVPVITISPANPTIAAGASVQLNATVSGLYNSIMWTPPAGLNNTAVLNPVAAPLTTTTYKLSVSAANQCNAEATVTVKVTREVFIPNSFTPNGDGLNDLFRIPPGTSFTLQRFLVYNTYGNLVFSTSDISRGWDGTYKGSSSPNGTYTYIIKGYDAKGEIFLKGTVLLIR
ncbi:MAG TPA: SBBP repeat-containing protein [Ferruginibacter sp.]|nr:SBBP repeat-containing protein [Ferruginibacter sp.]